MVRDQRYNGTVSLDNSRGSMRYIRTNFYLYYNQQARARWHSSKRRFRLRTDAEMFDHYCRKYQESIGHTGILNKNDPEGDMFLCKNGEELPLMSFNRKGSGHDTRIIRIRGESHLIHSTPSD
ncbi:hypothetical protein Btru_066209 [Bulinus truncatus]|nr:hypothetical protein Btru_066209 [Bulinus truncatus]